MKDFLQIKSNKIKSLSSQRVPLKNIGLWHDWRLYIACGFGSGAIHLAPGTMGTLVALILYLLFPPVTPAIYLSIWVILCGIAVYLAEYAERKIGVIDHPGIVCDEMVGFWLVTFILPPSWLWLVIAFGLFRFFDITKPWPISFIQRKLPGGWGCVMDDVAAAIYAWLILQGLIYVAPKLGMF